MHRRNRSDQLDAKRMFTAQEGADYCSMGVHSFRNWGKAIGAERRFGRSVRYDRQVIDNILDNMRESK